MSTKKRKKPKSSHSQSGKRNPVKLRTSREVYDRIRWDPQFDESRFVIGYLDRFAGMKEMPLSKFGFAAEIPWHRIWFFRCGTEILWDRKERIDLIFNPKKDRTESPAVVSQKETDSSMEKFSFSAEGSSESIELFQRSNAWRYSKQEEAWKPLLSGAIAPIEPKKLKLVSWNVLFDIYEPEKLHSEIRTPSIFSLLKDSDADVIALQEVTPHFCKQLLTESWVQEDYFVSSLPTSKDISPYGQIFLSRFPFMSHIHRYSPRKRALVAELKIGIASFFVGNVHFTSSRNEQRISMRKMQLQILLDFLDGCERRADYLLGSMIVGDCNFQDDSESAPALQKSYLDLWQTMFPGKKGFTFDPSKNDLALLHSTNGIPKRLDRMFLHTAEDCLQVTSIDIFADQSCRRIGESDLYPSDHYALRCLLRLKMPILKDLQNLGDVIQEQKSESFFEATRYREEMMRSEPTVRSALVLIPPEEMWEPLQKIRKKHDKSFVRWMPHINLLFGFVPEEDFVKAAAVIKDALAEQKNFEIDLSEVSHFQHRRSLTALLLPKTKVPHEIEKLQARLESCFPLCNMQSQHEGGYGSHMTFAQFKRSEEDKMKQLMSQWRRIFQSFKFEACELALISRREDQPFEIRERISFGQNSVGSRESLEVGTNSDPSEAELLSDADELRHVLSGESALMQRQELSSHDEIYEWIEEICQDILEQNGVGMPIPILHKFGSSRTGAQISGSDLDLVCIGDSVLSRSVFFQQLQEYLALYDEVEEVRFIPEALVPACKIVWKGCTVDLLYAFFPREVVPVLPERLEVSKLNVFEGSSARALLGCLEADALLEFVSEAISKDVFLRLLQVIKFWAKRRRLASPAFGFMGGYSWSVFTAWACIQLSESKQKPKSYQDWLHGIFRLWLSWDGRLPIGLGNASELLRQKTFRSPMPILTILPPIQNSSRQLTSSTALVLREEFERALKQLEKNAGTKMWKGLLQDARVDLEKSIPYVLRLSSSSEEGFADALGRFDSCVVGFLLSLEKHYGVGFRLWKGEAFKEADSVDLREKGSLEWCREDRILMTSSKLLASYQKNGTDGLLESFEQLKERFEQRANEKQGVIELVSI